MTSYKIECKISSVLRKGGIMTNKRLGFQFKQIHDAVEASANKELKEHDITFSQMGILCYLFSHKGENINPKDIEEHFNLSHPTVVGMLKRLENKGFIISNVSNKDRRCKVITLTDKATKVEEIMEEHKQLINTHITKGMNEEQVKLLQELLEIVIDNLSSR